MQMKKTGDEVIDTVLKNFRELARPIVNGGHSVNIDDCLERAISGACDELRIVRLRDIRERIWPEEDNIRSMCRQIVVEMEKRGRLLDIRKTSIGATLDDFIERSGLEMTYKLRNNNSAGLCFKIPSSRQNLIVNVSFSKLLSPGWLEATEMDVKEFLAITARLGRMKVTWRELD